MIYNKMTDQENITDLGFEPQLSFINNYPESFVTQEDLERERRMNIRILENNG